ncbi:helix-turn-helix transcriptional regulator [Glycomyces sp. NPDC047010]|uniref:helix-turn-helix domain-containing protein n=1 Tax=Glycomyces sp. NPDC047010 TaxID=3155023 RepID=UPI003410D6AB
MPAPVPPNGGTGPLADFQTALKALRERAGNPSFRQMAERAHVHYSTLSRVEYPGRCPSLTAVLSYVSACRGDEDLWRRQYRDLRRAMRAGLRTQFVPSTGAAGCELAPVRESATLTQQAAVAFAAEMRFLHQQSRETLEVLAARTWHPTLLGHKGLSPQTLSDLCNTKHGRIPHTRSVEGFLMALGLPESSRMAWLEVREALVLTRDTTDLTPPGQTRSGMQRSRNPRSQRLGLSRFDLMKNPLTRDKWWKGQTPPLEELARYALYRLLKKLQLLVPEHMYNFSAFE